MQLPSLSLGARKAVGALTTRFGLTPDSPDERVSPFAKAAPMPSLSKEVDAVFSLKQNLLLEARKTAKERGTRPTLEDYRLACERFSETDAGKAMVAEGKWTPKMYADLSRQKLDGFLISDPKKNGCGVEADYDGNNRDGDGQINVKPAGPFYDNVRFAGASLRDCMVQPATSYNKEIAEAKDLEGLTFDGMKTGDVFTFATGHYKNVNMTNIDDGEIIFASGTVDGLKIDSSKTARITVGENVVIGKVEANEEFRVVDLQMGKNSCLKDSDLGQCTVSMRSHFEPGATFQNVHLSGNLSGLDCCGLRLNNVAVNGTPITDPKQLIALDVQVDEHTVATASPDFIMQCKLKDIRCTMQDAIASIGTGPAPAPATPAPEVVAAVDSPPVSNVTLSGVSGGESVNFNQVAMSTAAAVAPRIIDPNEVASGANMQRNTQA